MTILAAAKRNTNAALMLDCIALGYIDPDERLLDPTWGEGTWWKGVDMAAIVHHDIAQDGVDFRDLPYDDNEFTQAVFDPPYVAVGGRDTSSIAAFNDAYGLVEVPRTVGELHQLMVDGLAELHRVVGRKGVVLFKAMNYVTGGKYRTQAYDAVHAVTDLYRVRDEFIHIRSVGPQPKTNPDGTPRRVLHARRNYSHLFALEVRK